MFWFIKINTSIFLSVHGVGNRHRSSCVGYLCMVSNRVIIMYYVFIPRVIEVGVLVLLITILPSYI